MRQVALLCATTLVGLMVLTTESYGQGGRTWGRDRFRDRMDRKRQIRPQSNPKAAAMEVVAGKVYVLDGSTLARIDLETLTKEATATLTLDAPRHPYLVRFDANEDGELTENELPNPESWERVSAAYDRNEDGAVSRDELPQTPDSELTGPAVIKVVGDEVLVLAGGRLYKFAARDLESRGNVLVNGEPADQQQKTRRSAERRRRTAERERRPERARNKPEPKAVEQQEQDPIEF